MAFESEYAHLVPELVRFLDDSYHYLKGNVLADGLRERMMGWAGEHGLLDQTGHHFFNRSLDKEEFGNA